MTKNEDQDETNEKNLDNAKIQVEYDVWVGKNKQESWLGKKQVGNKFL